MVYVVPRIHDSESEMVVHNPEKNPTKRINQEVDNLESYKIYNRLVSS